MRGMNGEWIYVDVIRIVGDERENRKITKSNSKSFGLYMSSSVCYICKTQQTHTHTLLHTHIYNTCIKKDTE